MSPPTTTRAALDAWRVEVAPLLAQQPGEDFETWAARRKTLITEYNRARIVVIRSEIERLQAELADIERYHVTDPKVIAFRRDVDVKGGDDGDHDA